MTVGIIEPPKRPKFYYLVNGIRTDAGNIAIWPKRMERLIEALPWSESIRAYSYTYETFATTRWIKQPQRVENVANDLLERKMIDEDRILVGHSNGCAIISEMFGKHPEIGVEEVHLIAGAVEDSFEKNGLNRAIARRQIGKLYLYCSHVDQALKWARMTHWVNWIDPRWGYGDLGKVGPSDMDDESKAYTYVKWFDEYDHSDYFSDAMCPTYKMSRFLLTANMILAPEKYFLPST